MPMTPDEIADALRERGLTMAAVGRRLRPPVSRKTVHANVHQHPGNKSARVRRAIARAIGRTEDEVFGADAAPVQTSTAA